MLFWRRVALVAVAVALALLAVGAPVERASAEGASAQLTLAPSGLPQNKMANIVVRGAGLRRGLRLGSSRTLELPPGAYTVSVRRVPLAAGHGVTEGAIAYPAAKKLRVALKPGSARKLAIRYAGVLNRGVRPLPGKVERVFGPASNPTALVLPGGAAVRAGTILLSGPSTQLPRGLISRVTWTHKRRGNLLVELKAVPVSTAVPQLNYVGDLQLAPLPGAAFSSSIAKASSGCQPPSLVRFGAHLDSVELRQASIDAWPPQMRLTLAVRSTESLGVAASALGVNCDWTLAELGPYQAVIPVGPVVIPVYATLPVKAGIHVNGQLGAATVNVASTTVASAAAGFQETGASLSQQGSNVWVTGSPSLSGSAKLSAAVGLQAGIGVAKGANVHLEADFGPEFSWSTGHDCEMRLNLGSMSAGVSVLGKDLSTPSFTPLAPLIWSGCHGLSSFPPQGGGGSGGGPTPPNSPGAGAISVTNAAAVDGADGFSCALLNDQGVACWGGSDSQGEFGDGGHGLYGPVRVTGITSAQQLSVGEAASCALIAGGTVRCWGWNPEGILGNGTTTDALTPTQVSGIGNATMVGVGEFHACATLSTGAVKCWGRNWRGQLGIGTTTGPEACGEFPCSLTPVTVKGIGNAKAITAGGDQSCAVLADGRVDCWGEMDFIPGHSSPTEVPGITNAKTVTAGYYQACALLTNGHVDCWGVGAGGGLGNGSTANSATPVEVSGITNATQISTGDDFSCALLSTGNVECWGSNERGQLGVGTESGPEQCGSWGPCSKVPVTVHSLSGASALGAGLRHACAALASGRVMCWGENNGWISGGTQPDALTPVLVP